MVQKTVTVCNVCEDLTKPTLPYVVEQGNRSVTLDLCQDDASPLEAFLPTRRAASKRASAKRPAKKASSRARKVQTLEEIERLKQEV